MTYCMAVDDIPWEESFANMTNPTLSSDGNQTAACVQVEKFAEGEIL